MVLISIPLATLIVWKGSASVAALAGLVMSPFLLPQYFLMACRGTGLLLLRP